MNKSLMSTMRGSGWLQAIALLIMFPSLVMMPGNLQANPSGGVVVHGGIEMNVLPDGTPIDPAFLQILQSTDKAIINWQDFSISAGEHTQFVQPSQMAAVLNRVVSGNPSMIAGMLSSNGKVVVVNQNGIVVTSSGVIDTAGGVVLSTLDISNGDFLNGMDDSFVGTSAAGVTNYGTIMSAGGDVILLGNFVDNAGIIGAPDGVVALGAGGNIVVHAQGENKISIMAPGVGAETGVNNSGTINGAAAELKAHGNVYALAINNSGTIRATGSATINGRVMLTSRSADGKTGGNIENTGEIRANNADGSGGFVMIDGGPGSNVGILDGKVSTNGIGDTAGGDIVMIGQTINIAQGAEVTANGSDGGSIIIGSVEETGSVTIGGKVSANGSSGNGGAVMVVGDSTSVLSVTSSGRIEATGSVDGGLITMQGGSIHAAVGSVIDAGGGVNGGSVAIIGQDPNGAVNLNGTVNATGGTGAGGVINVAGAGDVNVGSQAVMSADGASGGLVSLDSEGTTTQGGTITALGNTGSGGTANVTGQNVIVSVQSAVDVSGLTRGGQINIGGGFQGKDENLRNSDSTVVGGLATLKADAINTGDAGSVVVWSSGDTIFGGDVSARALGEVGRGGLIEVSGKQYLLFNGSVNASAMSGQSGTVLFDPGDVHVGIAGTTLPIASVNAILDTNTNVIIATESGDIIFDNLRSNIRDTSVQWNTDASLGIFASGDVRFNNHARTAGAGSISVIAGWTGAESDPILGAPTLPTFDGDPEAAWNHYVNGAAAGSFGVGGSIFINDAGNNRPVEVGSRYGNTNIAANNVFLSGAGGNNWSHAQLGFYDKGNVFLPISSNLLLGAGAASGDPLIALVGVNEVNMGGEIGVRMSDSSGVRLDTFIPYDDAFYGEDTQGNWWWRGLNGSAGGSSGRGNNLPELGAGSETNPANINVEARGALIMRAASNQGGSYAQIGHGGYNIITATRSWDRREDVANAGAGGVNDGPGVPGSGESVPADVFTPDGGYDRRWSLNFSSRDNRTSTSIARLAKVYGDINIRTGLTEDAVTGVLEATSASGAVLVQAGTGGSTRPAQIGHLGGGQMGSVEGHISVEAGGAVGLNGGRSWVSHASIGHTVSAGETGEEWYTGLGLLDDGDGVAEAGETGWSPQYDDAGTFLGYRLGGGQHTQFRYIYDATDFGNNGTNTDVKNGTLVTHEIVDQTGAGAYQLGADVTGMYGGTTDVTGFGAEVFTNLHGDITVTSATGGVILKAYNIPSGDSGARSPVQIGHGGVLETSEWTNAMGDIIVEANGVGADIQVIASNQLRSYAQIGHGGRSFGHNDTSVYLMGDISLSANGDVVIEGGGREPVPPFTRSDQRDAYAMVGHGGYETRGKYKTGDITVTVGGDLRVTGGSYGGTAAQIGHGGDQSYGQIGGDFSVTLDVRDEFGATNPTNWTFNETANIVVDVSGDILMDHLDPVVPYDNDGDRFNMDDSYTLIGHGGAHTTENTGTVTRQYWDHTGDVTVNAGGSLTMYNGGGSNGWYTRIGHGANREDRQSDGREVLFSGNVLVNVGTDLLMDANYADNVYGNIVGSGVNGDAYSERASANPVAIGNGGTRDGTRIEFDGDVTVTVGGDVTMQSGKGLDASYAQIGNGGAGSRGGSGEVNDTGKFTGDVTVDIGGSLTMTANPDGQVFIVAPIGPNYTDFDEIVSSYVMIGNGGAYWETSSDDVATMDGAITVRVGTFDGTGDLTMKAGDRIQGPSGPDGALNHARLINNFVQIGNTNSGAGASNDGPVGTANGDVTVQVGNNLSMAGGVGETDPITAANLGAYVQIGNGGPENDGTVTGNIEVKVGNNLTTTDGNGANNSYVKIGHGDWLRDTPSRSGNGDRFGDIAVNVGNTASFDHTMVGHLDVGYTGGDTTGTTFIGVSRAGSFFGGAGRLIDSNASGRGGSVFLSGSFAGVVFDELRFYMPGRSSNGLLAGVTRINSAAPNWVGADVNFTAPTLGAVRGVMASFQREDEIYLQPDWWSDNMAVGGGTPFPGGSVATVAGPGGFANLLSLTAGVLGDGTGIDAHGELTYLDPTNNSLGNYTLYYDAIQTVLPPPVVPPGGGGGGAGGGGFFGGGVPVIPPVLIPIFVPDLDLYNFLFFSQAGADLFGYTERDWLIRGDVVDGAGDTQDRPGAVGRAPGFFFGVSNRVLTPEEEERERRRRARYHFQIRNGGRAFYVYDTGSRQYSSFRLFGTPSNPSPATAE